VAGPPKRIDDGRRNNVVDLAEMRRQLDIAAQVTVDVGIFPRVFLPKVPPRLQEADITAADRADMTDAVQRAFASFQVWSATSKGRMSFATALDGKSAKNRTSADLLQINTVIDRLTPQAATKVFHAPCAIAAVTGSQRQVQSGPDETVLPYGAVAAYVQNAEGQDALLIAADLGFRDLQLSAQVAAGVAIAAFAGLHGISVPGHGGQRLADALRGHALPLLRSVMPQMAVRFQGAVQMVAAARIVGPQA
jgi:hypothetical protein